MTEINLTEEFLTAMLTFGAPALGLALLLGAVGLPLPGTFFVLAAGAFVRQGAIDLGSAVALSLMGAVAGDSISYALGHFAKGSIEHRLGQSAAWQKAQATFETRGGIAIFLTRFSLTPLAIPTNLIAGGSGFSFWRFLIYDGWGEFT